MAQLWSHVAWFTVKPGRELNAEKEVFIKKIKKEDDENETGPSLSRYSMEEDCCLRLGVKEIGFGKWAQILRNPKYTFKQGRTRDSLRMRAATLKLGKKKKQVK